MTTTLEETGEETGVMLAPEEVQPKTRELAPAEQLASLERLALERGMNPNMMARIRWVGNCSGQINRRIAYLAAWLEKHPTPRGRIARFAAKLFEF